MIDRDGRLTIAANVSAVRLCLEFFNVQPEQIRDSFSDLVGIMGSCLYNFAASEEFYKRPPKYKDQSVKEVESLLIEIMAVPVEQVHPQIRTHAEEIIKNFMTWKEQQ
jgi:hypothetical protein